MAYTYKYPRPAVTADCVVITKEAIPQVLLIERGADPFKGCWAFPGGFMNMDETTEECAIRELEEETGVAYLAIVDEPVTVTGQDDAAQAEWFPIDALPPLAFDHEDIMRDAISLYGEIG